MAAKSDAKKVLDDAMQLDVNERAFIAETLLESLDLDPDFPVSQEWLDEIRRRCSEVDSGRSKLLDSAAVVNELRAKYAQ
jgi:putative addiction module component (TIGR02574 family)